MRRGMVTALVLTGIVAACGSDRANFGGGGGAASEDGGARGETFSPNGWDTADAEPPCVGLQCKQVDCGGSQTTSISGVVLDPAGKNPIYNAVVYIPNAPLDPIKHGPVCDSCGGAPVSGSPVVATLTDPTGAFTLDNVPVDSNLPLVIQVGKWRRQITVPSTPKQCADNPITNPDLLRLPKNKAEGDLPLIALTTGCDPLHVLMQKIGIDPSEFTTGSGAGSVRVYAGTINNASSTLPGVTDATSAYAFWGSLSEMMKYDIIINACECQPHPRDTHGPAYENMRAYLDAGGRVFNSHYHLNFFGGSSENGGKADASLQSAADWALWGKASSPGPFYIDTTFPKGKALDEWLTNLTTASAWGPSIKASPKGEITISNAGDIGGTVPGLSQRWIYPANGKGAVYISINTPTTKPAEERCGRAVATDLHVGTANAAKMTEAEAALEFIFFDLASCVIDDATAPKPPPSKGPS